MINIIKIIEGDIKRLSVNVVAMVVIIGLTVIPCLYAWFNILSNWDPYGSDATKNLQVAVASSDQGIIIGNYELNIGDTIISNLKENTTIGWVFTDTAQEAISGVYSGEYYAALIIDEEFSADMISFLGGEIENPIITYYENEKKNAIAPKITSKVKTTIEREVDHAFVSTLAETILGASEYFATLDEQGNITGQGIEKLELLDSDLNGLIALLDSYIALMDSTESITEAGESITNSAESITKLAEEMAAAAQSSASQASSDIQANKNEIDDLISQTNSQLDTVENMANDLKSEVEKVESGEVTTEELISDAKDFSDEWGLKDNPDSIYSQIYNSELLTDEQKDNLTEETERVTSEVGDVLEEVSPIVDEAKNDFEIIREEAKENIQKAASDINQEINDDFGIDVESYVEAKNKLDEEVTEEAQSEYEQAKEKLINDLDTIISNVDYVRREYARTISPLEQSAIDTTAASIAEIEKLLNYNATGIDAVIGNLENYADLMDQSKDSLVKSRDEAVEMEKQLANLIYEIKSVSENEAYQKFMDLLESDPELLSDFISSPVEISDEYIYPIENNGSMTAPFYIVLSIWVGALIMSTILKTTVKDTTGMENVKNWQCFFGRYFITFMIGQIQTIITVFGAFLFVGIQCENYFLFWLACAWTSLVYSLLLYSFAYSFGNIGEALSVILMVIQVAGAGGTFPIEVLPKVFQVLYKFMPFNYSMNAVRECIGGFYENTYRNCMLTLIIYAVVAVFIGVVLYHPFKFLNEKIEHSKEKSGILL